MNGTNRFGLADGLDLAGVDIDHLWWRYAANGGQADAALLAARVTGAEPCDGGEHDLIAQTLNECFIDTGLDTFPVGYALRDDAPPARTATERAPGRAGSEEATARGRARDAQRRSALTALHASVLHEAAARLLEATGEYDYARRAYQRAADARERAGVRPGQREPGT